MDQAKKHSAPDLRRSAPSHHNAPPEPGTILNSIGEIVYDWDLSCDALRWGGNAQQVLGLDPLKDINTGIGFANHLAPGSPSSRYEAVMAAAEQDFGIGGNYQVQYGLIIPDNRDKAGRMIWVEDTGKVFLGPNQRPLSAHGVIRVITQRFEAERQLFFRSVFDPLTGALNRTALIEHIDDLLVQFYGTTQNFTVLMLSIKNLASINHIYSYDIADELICALTNRLREQLRSTDKIGRHASNRFALVMEDLTDERLEMTSRRLMRAIESVPFTTSAGPLSLEVHIGAAIGPRHARQAQRLLQHAEEALDYARTNDIKEVVMFDAESIAQSTRQHTGKIIDTIISALNERKIALAGQKMISAESGKTVGYEALLRLSGVGLGHASVNDLLSMADAAGLMGMVDYHMLTLSLQELNNHPDFAISVNIAGKTLSDPQFLSHFQSLLNLFPGCANRLTLEISESQLLLGLDTMGEIFTKLRQNGIKIALDGFGAGHVNFKLLRQFKFDLLKIDGAFMHGLNSSADDRYFVRTLISLAHHLSIPICATWVEDQATEALLKEWKVDFLQGFLYGRAQSLQIGAPNKIQTPQKNYG